jgi:uncharacterized membrane protein
MTPEPTTSKRRTWPLLVSVAINLVLAGLLAGLLLNLGNHEQPNRRHGAEAGRFDLSRESRQAVRDAFRDARERSAQAQNSHEQARAALHEALTASRFDLEAAKSAFAALRESEAALQASMQSHLIEKMAVMSQEERTRLAERLHRRRGRPRR